MTATKRLITTWLFDVTPFVKPFQCHSIIYGNFVFGGHNIYYLLLCRFAGNMERQQADNLLKSHSSGTYLIRERTAEAERFAISIK